MRFGRVLVILAYILLVAAPVLALLYLSPSVAIFNYKVSAGHAYLLLSELGHEHQDAAMQAERCGLLSAAFMLGGSTLPLACMIVLAAVLARRYARRGPIRVLLLLHAVLCAVGAIGLALFHNMHRGFEQAHIGLTLPEDIVLARYLADRLWIVPSGDSFAFGVFVWGLVGSVVLGAGLLAGLLGRRLSKNTVSDGPSAVWPSDTTDTKKRG